MLQVTQPGSLEATIQILIVVAKPVNHSFNQFRVHLLLDSAFVKLAFNWDNDINDTKLEGRGEGWAVVQLTPDI